nr:hypothetical protein [Tanacetum cinerariifolium]
MHNDIMAAGFKDRPPMLATKRYAQWQSCFTRYVDTKRNMKELKKCIFNGPYVMTRVLVLTKPTIETGPPVPEHTIQETHKNTLLENRAYIDAEAEAIHMILSGIEDEIYSTVDECKVRIMLNYIKSAKSRANSIQESKPDQEARFFKNKYTMKLNLSKIQSLRIISAQRSKPNPPNASSKSPGTYCVNFLKFVRRTEVAKRNKNVDPSTRTENERQTGQFRNQRTLTVAEARETVDYAYHKEKIKLCHQEEKGVPLSAEQSVWLQNTDEQPDEKELEAHYMYMAKIQKVPLVTNDNFGPTYDIEQLKQVQTDNDYNVFAKDIQHSEQHESINDTYVMETIDSNVIPVHSYMCNNEFEDDQNVDVNDEDERVELANLIVNLKLDIDENKNIQKQLRKANATLTHELNERKSTLTGSNYIRDRCKSDLHQKEVELEKYITYKDCQLEKEEIKCKYKETLDLLAQQKHQSYEALKHK